MSCPSSLRWSEHSPVYISGSVTVCLVHRESAAPPASYAFTSSTLRASHFFRSFTTNRLSPDHLDLARFT